MAGMTDWKPADSNKVLPNDNVAGQFRYRHYVNWEVFLGGTFGIGSKQATGSWQMRLRSPSDEIIFEQEVKITMQVVALGFFGLILFTWNFVKQDINTTVVAGQQITETNPAWTYTIGGGEFSEDNAYFAPGGGSDYSDATATITGFWESTIYRSQIPVGSKLDVVYDHWGLGVSARPEWQFSFGESALGKIDSTIDAYNQLYLAAPTWELNNGIAFSRSWQPYQYRNEYSTLNGDSPSIGVGDDGRVMMIKRDDTGVFLYKSLDAMQTWEKDESAHLAQGVDMPQVLILKGGATLAVVKTGATWRYTHIGSDGVYTDGTFKGEGDLVTASESDDGTLYAINEKGTVIATSTDGGKTFGENATA